MSRSRTALAVLLLLVPVVAGGFLLQEPPVRANARLFEQVLSIVSSRFVDSIAAQDLVSRAARGVVKELHDPYSVLLTPAERDAFSRGTNGRYGGTGMLLDEDDARAVTVQRVFPNTPAEDAGVQEGDRVVAIGDTSVVDWGLSRVSERLRGAPGTRVTVSLQRLEVPDPIRFTFVRREVHVPAVPYAMIVDGVGYIPLQTFNENATDEVRAAVQRLQVQGARAFALDLRGNGGGIVEQALAVSSLFLRDSQEIVNVRARGTPPEVSRAGGGDIVPSAPLAVLIDGGTASAAEIVAGALQDHDRALVVGSTTYGKGLVQSLYPLDRGYALKLTTGKWYTPSGRSINRARRFTEDGRLQEGRLLDGEIVATDEDSVETAATRAKRPRFSSDAGRVVYGGGGIVPDLLVHPDTLTAAEQRALRSLAPKAPQIQRVLQTYAQALRGTVRPQFAVPPDWRGEMRRRLAAAGVTLEAERDSVGLDLLTDELVRRVTRRAFGDAEAKRRALADDRTLSRAVELLQRSRTQQELLRAAGGA